MSKKRSRNIFANILLTLSLVLSVVGGAFLMSVARQDQLKKAFAADGDSPSSKGLTFISTLNKQTATGIAGDGQYEYESSTLNYVDINGLLYFANGSKLYSNTALTREAKDFTYAIDTTTNTVVVGEKITISSGSFSYKNNTYYVNANKVYSDLLFSNPVISFNYIIIGSDIYIGKAYTIKNDVSMFSYNNTTYYYKDGMVFDSISCNNAFNRDYDIVFNYSTTIGGTTYTGKNGLKRISINNSLYYEITLIAPGVNQTAYAPIKSSSYNQLYKLESGNLVAIGENTTATPEKIYVHSTLPSSGSIAESYIDVFGKKYYIYKGELYTKEFYVDINPTNTTDRKIETNTSNTITFKETLLDETTTIIKSGTRYTFNKVVINGATYYVNTASNPTQPNFINDLYSFTQSAEHGSTLINNTTTTITSKLDTANAVKLNETATSNTKYYPVVMFNPTINNYVYNYYVKITTNNGIETADTENLYTTTNNIVFTPAPVFDAINNITSFNVQTGAKTIEYSYTDTSAYGIYYNMFTKNGQQVYVNGDTQKFYTIRTVEGLVDGKKVSYPILSETTLEDVYITKCEETGNDAGIKFYNIQAIYKADTSIFEKYTISRTDTPNVTVTIATALDTDGEYQSLTYDGVKYYIIKNVVKKGDSSILTDPTVKQERTGDGYYKLTSTFTISTSDADKVTIGSLTYRSVVINSRTYYVASNDSTNLYTMIGDGSANNPYVATIASNLNFTHTINVSDGTVTAVFMYQLNNNTLYILTLEDQIVTNYFTYDAQYYYYDNKLYISQPSSSDTQDPAKLESLEMKDFDYSSVVSSITLNNYTYPVESAEYTTVTLDGKQYYLDLNTNKLYTNMFLGRTKDGVAYLISYSGEVVKGFFDYKIDNNKKIVTIFTGSPIEMTAIPDGDLTIDSKKATYSFNSNGSNYYVTEDNKFYIKASTLVNGTLFNNKYYYPASPSYRGLTLYVSRTNPSGSIENALYFKASIATITSIDRSTVTYNGTTNKIFVTPASSTSVECAVSTDTKWAYYNSTPFKLYKFEYGGRSYYFDKPASATESTVINETYAVVDNGYVNILTTASSTNYLLSSFVKTSETYSAGTENKNYYVDLFNPSALYDADYNVVEGATVSVDPVNGTAVINGANATLDTVVGRGSTPVMVVLDDFEINLTNTTTGEAKRIEHASAKYVSHEILNFNIDIKFASGNSFFNDDKSFNKPSEIVINDTKIDEIIRPDQNLAISELDTNATNGYVVYDNAVDDETGTGQYINYYTIIIKYSGSLYSIYCGSEKTTAINIYYYNADHLDKENLVIKIGTEPRSADILVNFTNAEGGDNRFTFTGFKDFIISTNNDGKKVLYDTSEYYSYTDENAKITFKRNYNIVLDATTGNYILSDDETKVEARRINFNYVVQANSVNNQTTETKTFNYILSNGNYYVLDDTNNVFNYFKYSIDSVVSEKVGEQDNAKRIANQVYIDSMAKNYDILSSNGKEYAENQDVLKASAQYENGSVIMLQNYLNAYELQTNTLDTSKEIENVYVQIGSRNSYDGSTIPTISSGITALSVQAFLKNEETAQYATKTEGFFNEQYGVRIKINSERSEEVYYASQANVKNTNFYWFNYFDLKGIEAIIRVGSSGEPQTYKISDASGYYTIVFTYSYIDENGNSSAGNIYTYSFYLSDNSNYVEYPTFGSVVQEKNGEEVSVKEIANKNVAGSQVEYRYNFQSFDVPTYVFNATKYNVGYSFKFNLESREYTSDFRIFNTATTDRTKPEYGQFTLYKNGVVDYSLKLVINEAERAIDYYYPDGTLYGSLYISKGNSENTSQEPSEYRLSLENYSYYNAKNKADYENISDYYKNGRLIKLGATDTIIDYYVVLALEELGEYQFKNVRLISAGADSNFLTTYEKYPQDVSSSGASNILESRSKTIQINGEDVTFTGTDTMQFGVVTNGFFTYHNTYGAIDSNLTYPSNSNASLKVYGVNTRFKKNNVTLNFRKLDENIYSDITANTTFKLSSDNTSSEINVKTLIDNPSALTSLYFDENNYYAIPLTNLQPIYFNNYAEVVYSDSFYVRYTNYTYTTYDNGHLKSVALTDGSFSKLNYTNKTSISQSGLYIVKIAYKDDLKGENHNQYFMFVIDNTAPNMEILVHNKVDDAGTVFISNTELLSTSRYTNKNFISVNYVKPNYFQGDITIGYKVTSYDQLTTLREGTYTDGVMSTIEGRYTFTIYYGVNSLSYNTTYVIVDKSTPTGSLYDVDTTDMIYTTQYNSYAFSSPKVFVTNKLKSGSGATVYAKLKTISLNSFNGYAEPLDSVFNAITTNVMLEAGSTLFDNIDMSDSPAYNFKTPDANNVDKGLTSGQILGLTDQTTIYILKLYDSAGNEAYYYYFYDTSAPYLLYLDKSSGSATPRKTLENNTTQSNTEIIWGNNKAIYIDIANVGTDNLYTRFIDKVNRESSKYNGMHTVETNGKLYLYVPISTVNVSARDGVDQTASTPNAGNFVNNAVVYTKKYANITGSTMENAERYWNLSNNTTIRTMFSGDKSYTFKITDSFGNYIQKIVIMNSSFAQESFNGDYNNVTYQLLDGTNKAYSIDKINAKYLALDDKNSIFKPQITYDYYAFNFENYLKQQGTSLDQNKIVYSDLAYDTEFGNLYKFSDGKYYPCIDINSYTIDTESDQGKSWEEINTIAKGKLFTANYPFSLTASNQSIEVNKVFENDANYQKSTIINEQNLKSAPGLYVFRRVYLYNSTGQMVTQKDIDTAGESSELSVLGEDYAVRYYVYYIDRNNIINLTYNQAEIDNVNSIGDFLQILLGSGDNNSKITAEILKTYELDSSNSERIDIITNKLRVKTDFPIDKYATANKLENDSTVADDQKLVGYSTSNLLNANGENFSILNNSSVFKYNISLYNMTNKVWLIENNVIKDAETVTKLANSDNYSLFKNIDYQLIISDNASFTYEVNSAQGTRIETLGGNKYLFNFRINHVSPTGSFQTKANDVAGTIEDLEVRTSSTFPGQNGKEVVYKNINKDYLQFSFAESLSVYDADINPYNVRVLKDGNIIFATQKSEDKGTPLSTFENSKLPQGVKLEDVLIIEKGDGANVPTTYTIKIFDKNSNKTLLSNANDNSTYKVIIEYIGSQADYTVVADGQQANYFTTSFEITVDTIAPEYNQSKLADVDKNLDFYCNAEYGKPYASLSASEKSDLLKKYVFAVSYLTGNSVGDNVPDSKDSVKYWATREGISESMLSRNLHKIITAHSTVFEKSFNDSIKMYYRPIGDNLKDYVMSYLPNEEGDNKLLVFNKYDTDLYHPLEYTHKLNTMTVDCYSFSLAFDKSGSENVRIFSDGYYEFFEEDEAGNLSRYLIYICDNTFAQYGVNYLSKERNTKDTLYYTTTEDGTILYIEKVPTQEGEEKVSFSIKDYLGNTISPDEEVVTNSDNIPTQVKINGVVYNISKVYNNSGFYIEDENKTYTIVENDDENLDKFIVREIKDGEETLINNSPVSYTAYYTIGDTFKFVPTSVLIDNTNEIDAISGFRAYMVGNQSSLALFRITGIMPILLQSSGYNTISTGDGGNPFMENNVSPSNHLFDQFITVNLYSGVKSGNDYTFTLATTLTSNPYKLTTEEFFNYVVTTLQSLVASSQGVYSYKIEIVNRFNDNFNIIVDLPDAELKLSFATLDDNLVVSLPTPSTNVKILHFNIYSFENGVWKTLIRDLNGKDIISKNQDDESTGLPSTTYTLGKGSYRFFIQDNFERSDSTYKNVGNADDTISTTFSKKFIQTGTSYTTSGDMNIILDGNLYQLKFGLKDCITAKVIMDESQPNNTIALSVFDGRVGEFNDNNKFIPWIAVLNGDTPTGEIMSINDATTAGLNSTDYAYLYYLNGKVYYDEACSKSFTDGKFVCKINTEDVFTSTEIKTGSDIGKTVYTLKPLFGEINNFVYTINWATDPENVTTYTLKIDRTLPVVRFISDTNQQVAPNGNYYKEFQITWTSNYSTTGTLTYTYNANTTTINISALDYYTVSKIGGYTLRIVDAIGNEYSISFYMVSAGNNYFSVFVNNTLEIFESEYVSINNTSFDALNYSDNKTVKYFYYLKSSDKADEILVSPDETKGIKAVKIGVDGTPTEDADTEDIIYKIYRNIGGDEYIICYARIIGIESTSELGSLINSIVLVDKNGQETVYSRSTGTNQLQKEFTLDQTYEKVQLKLNSYYNPNNPRNKGNKVFATHYYNGAFVKTYSDNIDSRVNTGTYTITITSTGVHTFDIFDFVGNKLDTITITLIKNVMYNTNGESPINNRFYNESVTINIPEMKQFYDTINLYATYNGVKYGKNATDSDGNTLENLNNIATIINNSYTFTQSGYYEITITATGTTASTGSVPMYKSTYCFTIVNPNVTKMTFGFSSTYGFNIVKLMKNNLDITSTLTSDDSLWLTSGNPDSSGLYTITLTGFDYITNEYLPFTFNVRINNEVPAILPLNYTYGTSTTKQVKLQYNGALIYSQVGESYIQISKNSVVQGTIDIDATTADELNTITLNQPGKWTVAIYNKDGNYIASYTINKATPLNSSARLIIIIAVVVVLALSVTFIILRKHTKFR